jgi:hypothetical protein
LAHYKIPHSIIPLIRTIGLVLCIILCLPVLSIAQSETDSIVHEPPLKEKKGSIFSGRPGKSFLMSLVVPGAGQIYNKSYLRVPFVWGAVGGMGYVLIYNTRQYNCLRDAYVARVDGAPLLLPVHCDPDLYRIDDPARIRLLRDEANVNRQWSIVGFAAVWLANGIDAFVDAHLKEFDIDEDLSIDIGPSFQEDPFAPMRMGIFVKF